MSESSDVQAWQRAADLGASPATPQGVEAPAADPGNPELAMQIAARQQAAGLPPSTEVDANALLAQIQRLQASVEALEAEKRASNAPEVLTLATAAADHLQAKADANPVIHADPDYTWHPVLEKAVALTGQAQAAADTGDTAHLERIAADIGDWVAAHAKRFPSLDYSVITDLLDRTVTAARKLAA